MTTLMHCVDAVIATARGRANGHIEVQGRALEETIDIMRGRLLVLLLLMGRFVSSRSDAGATPRRAAVDERGIQLF
jgi:hypothetical protein